MTIKMTENQKLIETRNDLLRKIDHKDTTDKERLKLIAQIYTFDEVITRNIEKRLQHIKTEFNEVSSYDTPMSKKQRYERMKQVYREAKIIAKQASDFKKTMREEK